MEKFARYRKMRIGLALAAATSAASFGVLGLGPSAAHADPPFNNTGPGINGSNTVLDGVGSNTLEDLVNAWSGEEPSPGVTDPNTFGFITPNFYSPVADATTGTRIYSFDAENPYDAFNTSTTGAGCITTKLGGNSFDRPNGSGAGASALSDALVGGSSWFEGSSKGPGGCDGPTKPQNVAGQIDFSRSSKPPSSSAIVASPADNGTSDVTGNCGPNAPQGTNTAGPCITYIAIGHDGVTYAYWAASGLSGAAVNAIPTSTLTTLYNQTPATGSTVVGGVTYFACLPQLSSGTVGFFLNALGITTTANADNNAAAVGCNHLEENNGNDFVAKVKAHISPATTPAANTVWVTPFSIGQWVAQNNGRSQDNSANARGATPAVTLGDIGGVTEGAGTTNGQPFTGSGTSLVSDPTFESNATWGRDIFLVVPWYKIDDGAFDSQQWCGIFGTSDLSCGGGTTGSGSICSTAAGGAQADLGLFGFTTATAVNAIRAGAAEACGTETTIKNQHGGVS